MGYIYFAFVGDWLAGIGCGAMGSPKAQARTNDSRPTVHSGSSDLSFSLSMYHVPADVALRFLRACQDGTAAMVGTKYRAGNRWPNSYT